MLIRLPLYHDQSHSPPKNLFYTQALKVHVRKIIQQIHLCNIYCQIPTDQHNIEFVDLIIDNSFLLSSKPSLLFLHYLNKELFPDHD